MMKKRRNPTDLLRATVVVAIVLLGLAAFAGRSRAQSPPDQPAFRKGEVLVEIKPGASIEAVNARVGTSTIQRIYGTNFYQLDTPRHKREEKFLKRLLKDPDVSLAFLNPVVATPISVFSRMILGFPDGFPTPGQSAVNYRAQQLRLSLDQVRLRSTGKGTLIAVIDTGISANHPEIAGHLWTNEEEIEGDNIDNDQNGLVDDVHGWDFLGHDNNPSEVYEDSQHTVAGHGTFIAGIIALVAPDAKILPVRAFDSKGVSDAFTVASAIKYATDQGADVINLSFGSPEESPLMKDAVIYARQRGYMVIAAMGNENESSDSRPQFPAAWKEDTMGIAAVDMMGHRAPFSNFGTATSVSAPGVRLISTYPGPAGPDYATWSGTSFAAPLAAAQAALLISLEPRKQDVRDIIEETAEPIDTLNPDFAGKLGKGRINPLAALQTLEAANPIYAATDLVPSEVEPTAHGYLSINVSGAVQEFGLDLSSLTPYGVYRIWINNSLIVDGAVDPRARATSFAGIKLDFSNTKFDDLHLPLPAVITPVSLIRHVEIRDIRNRVVMRGDFGTTSDGTPATGQSIEKETNLFETGVLEGAKGRVRAVVDEEGEGLRIEAEHLAPGSYSIVADASSLGSAVTDSGYLRAEYATHGSQARTLPASVRPVTKIRQVRVFDSFGRIVLQGNFQVGGDDIGGNGDGRRGGGSRDGDGGSGDGDGGGGSGDDDRPGGGSVSGGGNDSRREASLNRTGIDPDAGGRIRTRASSSRQQIEIEAGALNAGTAYSVVVDGVTLGSFSASSAGGLVLEWSTERLKMPLPTQLRPVSSVRHAEIRDSAGRTILVGELR
jgi:subtilase family protein/fervidolysin-like protein